MTAYEALLYSKRGIRSDTLAFLECGGGVKESGMANLTLVYGMRLLPADEVVSVGEAPVDLKNGNQAHVTMHVLEGSREQIESQLRLSVDAFFDFYPEI